MPVFTTRPRVLSAVLLATTALCASGARAQNTVQNTVQATAPSELEEVVVTAAGREQQVKDAPASISVITRETLERSPYTQITDVLLDVPGVTVTPGEGNSRDISIRGLGSAYTLILVDGKRLNSRESRTNGGNIAESGLLPPVEMIERIEVVRGPMSSLYGSDAMGGVINVITRRIGDEWTGSVRVNGTAQTDGDYGDYYDASVYASGPLIADTLGLQLSASMNRRAEDDILTASPERKDDSLSAKLGWSLNPNHDLLFEAAYYDQESIQTAGRTTEITEDAPEGTKSIQSQERFVYSINHSGVWGRSTSQSFVQFEDATRKETDVNIKNTVAQTAWIVPIGAHILNIGAYYNFADLYAPSGNGLTVDGNVRDAADRTQWALFAEDEWSLTSRFALTAGVRLDDHDLYGSQVSPRLYGVWKPTDGLIVKGGVSTGFRAPDIRQTLADWGQNSRGGTIYGNPDLEAETSLTYEGSVIYTVSPRVEIGLTAYQTDFKDKILRVTCLEAQAWCVDEPLSSIGRPPTTYVNIDDARIQGLEATLDARLTDSMTLKATGTLTDSEQLTGAQAGASLNQTPESQGSVALTFRPRHARVSGFIRAIYYGQELQSTVQPSGSNILAPAYTTVDVGGSYRLDDKVTLRAGIQNLFNHEMTYEEYGYVNDKARVWAGLTARF
ncbi:TonB-dependent receptor [Brevundimonas albigilva]|uniref:TonB-dependent receptor domain-containing protein n=1 Tax=Brevundimonas TaxID=41275 RepID=UPI00201B6626|nr:MULTISPECIES: TonB-dependent receptor [Brevundimonas]UQV19130.1 TonB-dependent receptor [Brevundimonas albigilva]